MSKEFIEFEYAGGTNARRLIIPADNIARIVPDRGRYYVYTKDGCEYEVENVGRHFSYQTKESPDD